MRRRCAGLRKDWKESQLPNVLILMRGAHGQIAGVATDLFLKQTDARLRRRHQPTSPGAAPTGTSPGDVQKKLRTATTIPNRMSFSSCPNPPYSTILRAVAKCRRK
jgi:hypothetical protein